MKPMITKNDPSKAEVFQEGRLKAFDLAPEEKALDLIFHWVEVAADSELAPEKNDVDKTFLVQRGSGTLIMEGKKYPICLGDAIWLPSGSVHTIRTDKEPVVFIVVKKK